MIKSLTFLGSLLFFIIATSPSLAQNDSQDLNGFRLGQYRAVAHRELGEPDMQGTNGEDIAYEAFLINEAPTLYMVFQYQRSEPDRIWSIQITGNDEKHDPRFKGLRFGMAPTEVEKRLGKPSKKIDAGEHGIRWEFDGPNYSVEINASNKLSSIRIVEEFRKEPDLKNLPKFVEIVKTLQTGSNAELADFLAPDMELYEGGTIKSFEWPLKREIEQDKSGVFAAIRRLSKELSTVEAGKSDHIMENIRFRSGQDPQHVIRLPKLKGVTEIAFKWNGERWLIWEFGARPVDPAPQNWKSIYKPGSLKELVTVRIPELIKVPNMALAKDTGKPLASFSYNSYPTSASVKFTGESRKTPESTLTLISLWLETIGKSKDLAKRFEFEFKFIENGVEYWLPVQNPLPERFPKEIKEKKDITIYLSWIGIKFENDKPELLTVVNEFAVDE